jgi:hypothetical protein
MRLCRADDHGQMEQRSPSRRMVAAHGGDLLDLVGELIDAHTDTVQLIMGDEHAELDWLAHCDYLRALQRLGLETLAHHHQRGPIPPLGPSIMARVARGFRRLIEYDAQSVGGAGGNG